MPRIPQAGAPRLSHAREPNRSENIDEPLVEGYANTVEYGNDTRIV